MSFFSPVFLKYVLFRFCYSLVVVPRLFLLLLLHNHVERAQRLFQAASHTGNAV